MKYQHHLSITTRRLELLPCSMEVASAAIAKNKSLVEKLLPVGIPDDWYQVEVLDILPMYAEMLANDPSQLGWGVWLIIHTGDCTLIGDMGFLGKPDDTGTVELGYEVLPAYRNQGYAFEAVEGLVEFAFTQPELKRIIAHCPPDQAASISILEKLGMQEIARDETLLKWELKLESRGL